ncbi:MAG: (Fe-S)-binding protein [Caldilineales bacterium]|nr:(Fe-S)-binding protein [Caldilineales bacterium]
MTVALLAPCLATAIRPSLQSAVVTLGQKLGLDIVVVEQHTCCGLTAWQAGQVGAAQDAVIRTVRLFQEFEATLTTSSACLRMLRQVTPGLLAGGEWAGEARKLAGRSFSLGEFLLQNTTVQERNVRFSGSVAYFHPCTADDDRSSLALLAETNGITSLTEVANQCCGFGGNLWWRRPDISRVAAEPVVAELRLARADCIVTSDSGCLTQLAGFFNRKDDPPVKHIAEFLAEHCS